MFAPMKVTYTDGREVVVTSKTSDGIRFERAYNMPMVKAFGMGEVHMEHLWFFAYLAVGRESEQPSFDEWMDTVESVEFVVEEPALPLDRQA